MNDPSSRCPHTGPLRFDSNHFYADGEPFVDDRLPGG
jgi:hypothetical protein